MQFPGVARRRRSGDWIDREIASLRTLVENGADGFKPGARTVWLRERVRRSTAASGSAWLLLRHHVLHVLHGASWLARARRLDITFYGLSVGIGIVVGLLVARL
jgi:hypothetical protein